MSDSHEPTIADSYFVRNNEYGVAVCRQCAHGVKPNDIVRHLTSPRGTHRISEGVALHVFDVVQNTPEWDRVSNESQPRRTLLSIRPRVYRLSPVA